jgi:hypothetical protein
VASAAEGSELATPAEVDPNRFRLTGRASGQPPFQGRVVHRGWTATRCELPTWSGKPESAMILAPVELEIS